MAEAEPELAGVARALCEGKMDGVAEPVGEWEDDAQTVAHTEALVVGLSVAEREPLGDGVAQCDAVPETVPHGVGVAECEAVGRSDAEPLPLAVREAMLALPLEEGV